MPVDKMVVAEAVRRRLEFGAYYVDMVLYGFIDKQTGRDLWAPKPRLTIDADGTQDDARDEEGRADDAGAEGEGAGSVGQ